MAHNLIAVSFAFAAVLGAYGATVPAQSEPLLTELRARAEEGDADAQYQLALQFKVGVALPRDDTEAAAWLLRAAEQGHLDAQFMLGTMYHEGRGVPKDDFEAAAWVRMAAEAGHPDAPFLLGSMYQEGRGVFKDRVLACMWFILAASRSSDLNREVYMNILNHEVSLLTHEEVREAQRLAREWDEAHSQNAEDVQVR